MKKAVILLSGGMDSATTLYLAKKRGYRCLCLIFDYGQRQRKETLAAKRIARGAGCQYEIVRMRLPEEGSALLDRKAAIPRDRSRESDRKGIPPTYVPARNLIFLSIALGWAETVGAEAVFIGANCRDFSGYPDCRPEFFRDFRRVVRSGTRAGRESREIRIEVPLLRKSKAEIVRWGRRLRVPLELTWSCYLGGKVPCGRCDACILREQGFREAEAGRRRRKGKQ